MHLPLPHYMLEIDALDRSQFLNLTRNKVSIIPIRTLYICQSLYLQLKPFELPSHPQVPFEQKWPQLAWIYPKTPPITQRIIMEEYLLQFHSHGNLNQVLLSTTFIKLKLIMIISLLSHLHLPIVIPKPQESTPESTRRPVLYTPSFPSTIKRKHVRQHHHHHHHHHLLLLLLHSIHLHYHCHNHIQCHLLLC